MSTPMETLLGGRGQPTACKRFSADVAIHWYPPNAKVGTPCLCGEMSMSDPDEEDGALSERREATR